MKFREQLRNKLLVLFLGCFFALFVLEVMLRLGGTTFLFVKDGGEFLGEKKSNEYRILCLGDSETCFGGLGDNYSESNLNSYPSILEVVLNEKKLGKNFRVINGGVAGANSTLIYNRLESNILKYDPDMLTVMVGINDSYFTATIEDCAGLRSILRKFRTYILFQIVWENLLDTLTKVHWNDLSDNDKFDRFLQLSNSEQQRIDEFLKASVGVNSKSWDYFSRGHLLQFAGKWDEAIPEYEKAIKADKRNDLAYEGLMFCYKKTGKQFDEKVMIEDAIQVKPENARMYRALGMYYMKNNEYLLAKECFKKARRLQVEYTNTKVKSNLKKIKKMASEKGIKIAFLSYPLRSIETLENIFISKKDLIFVDNSKIFFDALKQGEFEDYFVDNWGGDVGHCSAKGNRILAKNIADNLEKYLLEKQ